MTDMTDLTTADLLKRSVTASDVGEVSNGVINMIIPLWPSNYNNVQALPPSPPAYWTPTRDDVLRSTVHHEAMWAAAVSIAITKMASKSWEIKSDIPRRAKTGRELLLYADGRTEGHTQFIYKHLRDFLTTDNGAFIEIVRRSSSLSSQIIGLRHLDSRRCQRTGDPDIPVLYRDRRGQYHELKDYQVMYFSDMPEPSETFYGVGQCAASRSYAAIYKLAAIERYISEKISGLRPLAIYIVNGMVQRQIEGAISSAQSAVVAQGVAAYMGAVIVGIPADKPPQVATIPLAELPDRFERKEEFDIALLTYADNIGLDIQDLQPLSGQALGTGAQSEVLHDKASGKGLIAWQQEFTHKYNEQVLPELTEFLFIEHDYRDMKAKADITKARADAYGVMSDKGFILPEQGTSILVDQDELPKEFLEQITATRPQETTISDTEKPEKEGDIPEAPAQPANQPPQQPPQPPQQGQPPQPPQPPPPPAPATKELTDNATSPAASVATQEQQDAISTAPTADVLTKVIASQDEARLLYERLRKKKELSERMAISIDAISTKHLTGEHDQKKHGAHGLGGSNDFILGKIKDHLDSSGVVQVTTYMRSTVYDKRHKEMFSENPTTGELYVREGRSGKVSLRYASLKFGRMVKKEFVAEKHLVGEHNQHFHGNRGTITADTASAPASSPADPSPRGRWQHSHWMRGSERVPSPGSLDLDASAKEFTGEIKRSGNLPSFSVKKYGYSGLASAGKQLSRITLTGKGLTPSHAATVTAHAQDYFGRLLHNVADETYYATPEITVWVRSNDPDFS